MARRVSTGSTGSNAPGETGERVFTAEPCRRTGGTGSFGDVGRLFQEKGRGRQMYLERVRAVALRGRAGGEGSG